MNNRFVVLHIFYEAVWLCKSQLSEVSTWKMSSKTTLYAPSNLFSYSMTWKYSNIIHTYRISVQENYNPQNMYTYRRISTEKTSTLEAHSYCAIFTILFHFSFQMTRIAVTVTADHWTFKSDSPYLQYNNIHFVNSVFLTFFVYQVTWTVDMFVYPRRKQVLYLNCENTSTKNRFRNQSQWEELIRIIFHNYLQNYTKS